MKTVAIVGCNSLLAVYLIDGYSQQGYFIHLFGGADPLSGKGYPHYQFHFFRYPDQDIDMQLLLPCSEVVYCAATGVQAGQPVATTLIYEVNAFLPIRIINFLNDNAFEGNWVSFGSYFEIGNNNREAPFTEAEVIKSLLPVPNHYCSSKRLLTRFVSNGNFKSRIWHLILPTIYGERENRQRLIPYIVAALKNDASDLKLSAGQQVRQYIHCKDVASLLVYIAQHKSTPGIYNITAGEGIKIATLVSAIFSLLGRGDAARYLGTLNTRDESMKVLLLDTTHIQAALPGWKAATPLEAGLKEYV